MTQQKRGCVKKPDRPSGMSCRDCQQPVIVSKRLLMRVRALPLAAAEALEDGPRMGSAWPSQFWCLLMSTEEPGKLNMSQTGANA